MADAGFQFRPIEIPGGWRGEVLVSWPRAASVSPSPSTTSTPEEWRAILRKLVADPESFADRVLKHSRTAQVLLARVELPSNQLDIVCKHSNSRGLLRRAVQVVRRSRERRNWKRAFSLLNAGISTPLPRAILENQDPRAGAWLVTEAIPDSIDLDGIMSWQINDIDPATTAGVKRAMVIRLVELCTRMERSGVIHKDFKASNILVTDWKKATGPPSLWLVDLDGVRCGRRLASNSSWPAVVRLAASLVGNRSVTRTDGVRFLKSYLASVRGDHASWRDWWRRLARDVERYNQRSRRRKSGKLDGFGND